MPAADLRAIAELIRAGALDAEAAAALLERASRPVGEARRERDALIREYVARFCAGMSGRAAARKLRRDLTRYETTAYRHHAHRVECPRELDDAHKVLWRLLQCGARLPESDEAIRQISAGILPTR